MMTALRLYRIHLRLSARLLALLVLCGLAAGAFVLVNLKVAMPLVDPLGAITPTLGDHLCAYLVGILEFRPEAGRPFVPPIAWLLVLMPPLAISLVYPLRDLDGISKHMLIAAGSRRAWWLSLCLWTLTASACYLLALGIIALTDTLASGDALSLEAHTATLNALNVPTIEAAGETFSPVRFLTVGTLMFMGLQMCLLALALLVKPTVSFAAAVALLIASAYWMHPALPGNALMLARWDKLAPSGVALAQTSAVAATLLTCGLGAGFILFDRFDIHSKEMNR